MKRVEIYPWMKFNLKKETPTEYKNIIKFIILARYVKTSDDYFFRKVTLLIIFVCLFSYCLCPVKRLACNFIKKETVAKIFFCEFWKISNTPSYRTPPVAASGISRKGAAKL